MKPRDPRVDPESGIPAPGTNGQVRIKAPKPAALPRFEETEPLPPPAPLPKKPSIMPSGPVQTIAAITALVAALGGGATLKTIFGSDGITREQAEAIRGDLKKISRDVDEIKDHLEAHRDKEIERWDIASGAICKLNGGTRFARGVNCDAVQQWDGPPLDEDVPWIARADWPPFDRAPR